MQTGEPVEQQFNSNCCDRETQTVYDQYILGAKLETMILRNQSVVEERKESDLNLVNMMDPSVVLRDRKKTKFFTGLSPKRVVFTPGSQSPGIRKGNTVKNHQTSRKVEKLDHLDGLQQKKRCLLLFSG